MKYSFTFLFLFLFGGLIFSQSYKINWNFPTTVKISDEETQRFLSFDGAQYNLEDNYLPRYIQQILLTENQQSFKATFINTIFEPLLVEEVQLLKKLSKIEGEVELKSSVLTSQKKNYAEISFIPIRKNKNTGKFEKLVSFELSIGYSGNLKLGVRSSRIYSYNSVLNTGDWYKIAIANDGVYKLSYSFLQNLGIDMSLVNPKNIRIYGNGGGMLPELNSVSRPDDLVENAVFVNGESDGVFNVNDFVLFYGKGPNTWSYSGAACGKFSHTLNLYSDSAYYFINFDIGVGKRIQTQASSILPVTKNVTSFDDYAFHENDNVNSLKSGKCWYGEYFENNPSYNFPFSFPDIDMSSPAVVKVSIASRCFTNAANYIIGSQSGSASITIPSTIDALDSDYVKVGTGCFNFNPTSPLVTVNITKQTSNAIAWLDYVEVNLRRLLKLSANQMIFRDVNSVGANNISQFNITSNSPIQVWDVTDISNVKQQDVLFVGASSKFTLPTDNLRQFVAFNGTTYYTPLAVGKVFNQNLHALSNRAYIIIAHPDFFQEAEQLAAYHENVDGLSSVVVTTDQIYNEFSSGAQDVSAIRDFVKMFYDKANTTAELPKYLLLFGDGSFDPKHRFSNNTNFIITYQSENSSIATASYVSDDFFGLLDDNEGVWAADAVDLGIGRFPVKSKLEAQTAVNKVINYKKTGSATSENNSSTTFGNWRNIICFIGDDQDLDTHVSQADQLATLVDTTYGDYNVDKIYLDAYLQETKPGGNRYPLVVEAINRRVDQGALVINYTGHGGELGLAHERIVDIPQINKWSNGNKLFLFYTASCEVSRYDDPNRTSAGEYAFLNSNGGAIALFSTVRVVYSYPNFNLNRDFYKAVFKPINGKMPRLGDIYKFSKTQPGGNSVNSRNFTLLGDPALTLAYPKYDIATDSVNSVAVSANSSDTIKALSFVTVSGHVKDGNGNLNSTFNGVLYPTVYDKSQSITTLSNDGVAESPPFTFKLQNNILYNGKVSVINGMFKFSFIVPKDIAYNYGFGRISYYSDNGEEDANGFYEKIVVGGSNASPIADLVGPETHLYMNDTKFVFGGLTNENPYLYSILKDANGINTVGNGIGHDITAVLDGSNEKTTVLNDYYQADLNSYKSGTIRYPYSDLTEGKHTLKLKVWDVYNNSSECYTEFIVAKSGQLALSHVLNYPNPFTTRTQFYFEHNQSSNMLDVEVQIFTIAGKLVKTINKIVGTNGYRSDPMEWDGRDDFGDKIGRGVYIYRIKVKTNDGSTAEKYEKLVILN
jgi:hypothetical protein